MRWRDKLRGIERALRRVRRYDAEHAEVSVGTNGAHWTVGGQTVDEATWCRITARIRVVDTESDLDPWPGVPVGDPLPAAEYRAWVTALQARVAAAHAARGIEAAEQWIVVVADEDGPR